MHYWPVELKHGPVLYMVNFLPNTHNRHPVVHWRLWCVGCLLRVSSLIDALPQSFQCSIRADSRFAPSQWETALLIGWAQTWNQFCVWIMRYTEPCYNGTQLYMPYHTWDTIQITLQFFFQTLVNYILFTGCNSGPTNNKNIAENF